MTELQKSADIDSGIGDQHTHDYRIREDSPASAEAAVETSAGITAAKAVARRTCGRDLVELLLPPVSGSVHSPQIIEFLSHLLRHIPGKLLIVWDGLPGHRSVRYGSSSSTEGRLWLEYLPGYAPELNPVEYLWSHWKQHELPNFCPTTFGQLSDSARQALRRMRRRPTLVCAFWEQAELFPL